MISKAAQHVAARAFVDCSSPKKQAEIRVFGARGEDGGDERKKMTPQDFSEPGNVAALTAIGNHTKSPAFTPRAMSLRPMDLVKRYQQYAAECARMAQETSNEADKAIWLSLAQLWTRLAGDEVRATQSAAKKAGTHAQRPHSHQCGGHLRRQPQ